MSRGDDGDDDDCDYADDEVYVDAGYDADDVVDDDDASLTHTPMQHTDAHIVIMSAALQPQTHTHTGTLSWNNYSQLFALT